MRILIIEDNEELAFSMKEGLQNYGFSIDVAFFAEDGEEKSYVNSYDAHFARFKLPDKDGLEVLKALREFGQNVPIIIITAREDVEDRALGLDLGADDYLVKPVELLELRARVSAVIRRSNGRSNNQIEIGNLIIDPRTRKVFIGKTPVLLSAKEFDILEYIASKHPAVVSAEEIIEHVYNDDFSPFSSVLRVHLARIRGKTSEISGYNMLDTMRGKGYSLCVK